MSETKRIRRSKEEIIAAYESKIGFHESKIANLRKKIDDTKSNALTMKDIANAIKARGLPLEVVMKAIEELKID